MNQQIIVVDYRFPIKDQWIFYLNWQNSPQVLNWQQFFRQNEEIEREYLSNNFRKCPLTNHDGEEKIINLDIHKLHDTASSRFYDYQAMNAIRCVMDTFIYEDNNDHSPVGARYWLRDLFRIGEPSAEGIVFSTNFLGSRMFVIKAALQKEQSLTHELVVGTILNKIRRDIPNFVFTYTGFACSPPTGSEEHVADWCQIGGGGQVSYLLLENVKNAVTLTSYIKNQQNNFSRILEKIVQVLISLQIAQEKFAFTHYDLHTDNILIRHVPQMAEMQINYNFGEKSYYLRTEAIATIIDYGFASIRLPTGQMVGRWDSLQYLPIDPGLTFPMYDMFRLLTHVLAIVYQHRQDIFPQLEFLFYFFMRDISFENYLRTNFSLSVGGRVVPANLWKITVPINAFTQSKKPFDLLNYILQKIPVDLQLIVSASPWPDIPFLGCQNGTCNVSQKSALQSFNVLQYSSEDVLQDIYNSLISSYDLTDPINFPIIRKKFPIKFFAGIIRRIYAHDVDTVNKAYELLREIDLPQTVDLNNGKEYLALLSKIYMYLRQLQHFVEHSQIISTLAPIYENSPDINRLSREIILAREMLRTSTLLTQIMAKLRYHARQITSSNVVWRNRFTLLYNAIHFEIDQLRGKYTTV